MDLVADILLGAGAFGAGLYCFVLSKRLNKFTDLENGMGGAVAVLSSQVTELQTALDAAQNAATHSSDSLHILTERAENAAKRLEVMVAALHDLPTQPDQKPPEEPAEPMFSRHNGDAR